MEKTIGFALLGFGLHLFVGVAAGRVLAYLGHPNDGNQRRAYQAAAYVLGLPLVVVYGFAAGHLARALRSYDALLVSFAVTMLAACLVTYLRRRQ